MRIVNCVHVATLRRVAQKMMLAGALGGVLTSAFACGDGSGLTGKQGYPAGTGDPNSFNTPDGALGLYNATLAAFQYIGGDSLTELGSLQSQTSVGVFEDYILKSGLLTDELQPGTLNLGNNSNNRVAEFLYDRLDARLLPEGSFNRPTDELYTELQGVRGGAAMAIGVLTKYDTSASTALAGHMYALSGYSEIFLADLYCSGVPLSTLNFQGDFTYRAGSTTAEIYRDAIKQFDLAIAAASDSSRILNLARIGKARALLSLGLPDSAASAVASVPDGFVYQFPVDWTSLFSASNNRRSSSNLTVSNGEGRNGLPYVTNGVTDPRTASGVWANSFTYRYPLTVAFKYSTDFSGADPSIQRIGTVTQVSVADWIEVRLIRAEAALAVGNVTGWLNQLNDLRHTATSVDLGNLTDPGTQASRIALLFRERAYWLFMTGHRQGDFRRMIRQYHFTANQLYPTGAYPAGSVYTKYGADITAPVPADERNNPLFAGCLSRGA